MDDIQHPLISIRDVPIKRRPRFTTSEAVVLNALVNAAPDTLTISTLREKVSPFSPYLPTRASIFRLVGSLRAKLGEKRYRPSQIVSVKNDDHQIIGFRWVDDEEG